MPLESKFQADLIKDLKKRFPGCVVLKNDSSYMQGILDLTVFYGVHWAMLEVKRKPPRPGTDDFEPNQEYYIELLNDMSFAACIYPENKREVLTSLNRFFQN